MWGALNQENIHFQNNQHYDFLLLRNLQIWLLFKDPALQTTLIWKDPETTSEGSFTHRTWKTYSLPVEPFLAAPAGKESSPWVWLHAARSSFLFSCLLLRFLFYVLDPWLFWASNLKNSKVYYLGLSCSWALYTAQSFGFKLHLV